MTPGQEDHFEDKEERSKQKCISANWNSSAQYKLFRSSLILRNFNRGVRE